MLNVRNISLTYYVICENIITQYSTQKQIDESFHRAYEP